LIYFGAGWVTLPRRFTIIHRFYRASRIEGIPEANLKAKLDSEFCGRGLTFHKRESGLAQELSERPFPAVDRLMVSRVVGALTFLRHANVNKKFNEQP
jgi:hypothetical protein